MSRGSVFWGVILILAGGLFLLDTLGFLTFNVWAILWPLFLIGAGLWILFGVFLSPARRSEHVSIPLEGAEQARLHLKHGAGRLNLRAGAGVDTFLEGDFNGGVEVKQRSGSFALDVQLQSPPQFFPFFNAQRLDWNLALNSDVALDLELDTGANDAVIDLRDLRVRNLRLSSGASSTRLTLPAEAGFTRAEVRSGAASVRIEIPQGVAAAVRTSSGLASVQIDTQRFPNQGGEYRSPDFEGASNRIELRIETGVGSVQVY